MWFQGSTRSNNSSKVQLVVLPIILKDLAAKKVINQNSLIIIGKPDLEIRQQPSTYIVVIIVFICYYLVFHFYIVTTLLSPKYFSFS